MAAWKGSVESNGAKQEHFPVAAQGHTVPRESLRIHNCALRFFFIASFSELPSQVFCHLFVSPHALSFNCFSCSGGCVREEESGKERWWLAATKQTAAAAGRPSSRHIRRCWWAGRVRAGTSVVLRGILEPTGTGPPAGPRGTHFLPPVLRLQPAAEGQYRGAGGNDISNTADVCSVDVSQSLISKLFVISVALL